VRAAVTEHAKHEEKPRHEIEIAVKYAARHPEPAESGNQLHLRRPLRWCSKS
jgi:hypothetical protein